MITIVDIIYILLVFKEITGRRTFSSIGVKIKHIFQEIAILIFLVVLTVFAIVTSSEFRSTNFFKFLEVLVVICVIMAIGAEVIALFWSITVSIVTFLKERKSKEAAKKIEKITQLEKTTRVKDENEEGEVVDMRKMGIVNNQLTRFSLNRGNKQSFEEVSEKDSKKSESGSDVNKIVIVNENKRTQEKKTILKPSEIEKVSEIANPANSKT